MRLVIVPDDSIVIIDNVGYRVDCSSIDPTIHAVQWFNDHGEVEFKANAAGERPLNQKIEDISEFQTVIDLWEIERDRPPLPPPRISDAFIVAQSYRASQMRKADAMSASGKTYDAVKLLLKNR